MHGKKDKVAMPTSSNNGLGLKGEYIFTLTPQSHVPYLIILLHWGFYI